MLKAALNGSRSRAEHKNIPVTAAELLADAKLVVEAGADAIHFHVRDENGAETLEPFFVASQVSTIKTALPALPVGISTGSWIEPDVNQRVRKIADWYYLPDFVSVNGHETGFERVAQTVLAKGIGVEAGLRDAKAAADFVASGLLAKCFRILIEPESQDLEEALPTVESIISIIKPNQTNQVILLHGFEHTSWRLAKIAASRGYATRIGFEDTLLLESGALAVSNEELVREASKHIKTAVV